MAVLMGEYCDRSLHHEFKQGPTTGLSLPRGQVTRIQWQEFFAEAQLEIQLKQCKWHLMVH